MKLLLLLAASRLAYSLPHGPDDDDDEPVKKPAAPKAAPAKTPAPMSHDMMGMGSAAAPLATTKKTTHADADCKLIYTDVGYPDDKTFHDELKGVEKRPPKGKDDLVHPDFRLRAMNYDDVVKAVRFASKYNIRLTVINSGHDFLGRNDAPSGLSLDVSLLDGITVHEEFTPTAKGAPKPAAKANVIVPKAGKQAAVTIGIGMATQRLNNALGPSKLVTVGAAHGSVAPAGGFGQTAGHSPISDKFGLGADQFLEFKVVTPDGNLRVANKVSNPDLFWALRGGGGSTFGVVVEATMKAHPDFPITFVFWELNSTDPKGDGLWDAYTELHRNFADFATKQISGYYYNYGNRLTGAFLHKDKSAGNGKAEAVWSPILKKMLGYGGLRNSSFKITEHPNFNSYFDSRFGKIGQMKEAPWDQAAKNTGKISAPAARLSRRHGPGDHDKAPVASAIANLDSRLLGAKELSSKNLREALYAAFPHGLSPRESLLQGHLVAGGKVHQPDDDTSVLPAWRSALTHVIGYKVIGKSSVDSLRKLAPNMGAYANEAFALEENWKQSFWGSNYPKLSQIKTKYDPNMLLWTTPGINADLYEARNGRVCKRRTPYNKTTAPISDNVNNGRIMTGSIN